MTTRFDSDGNEIQDAGSLAYADDLEDGIVEEPPRTSRKPAIAIMAAFVVGALVLFGFALWPRSSTATATVTGPRLAADPAGAQAPVFSGTQVTSDAPISLADYKGKVVVVNFWASWCSTCKEEAQTVADVEKKWRAKGVVFLGVDTHDTTAGAHTYYKTYGLEYASVIDSDSRIGASYGVTGLPETFFIAPDGTVVDKYISVIDAATLDQMIQKTIDAA